MKQLSAFWEKTLNLPPERIAEILYKKADDETLTDDIRDEAISELLDLDKARISKLKADANATFDNGYKKAEKEVASRWEKTLREKFALETDAEGDALLAAIEEKVNAKKPEKVTSEDDIKKHKLYLELESKYLKDIELAKKEGEKVLNEYKTQQVSEAMKNAAKSKAKDLLLGMKPVLEEDQTIADTRISDFLRELDAYDFQETDGGLIPIKEGKRVENEHSHPISFEDLAKQIAARRFKFQVQDEKGNGGNKNNPNQLNNNNVTYTGKIPASETELWQAHTTLRDPVQQKALMDAYEKAHGVIEVG